MSLLKAVGFGMKLNSDLEDTIKYLKRNHKLFVVSPSPGDLAMVSKYMDVTVCFVDKVRKKPSPSSYKKAFIQLKEMLYPLKPKDCLVVEDTPEGIISAKKNGLYAIGYTTENEKPLWEAGADLVVTKLNKDLFKKLLYIKPIKPKKRKTYTIITFKPKKDKHLKHHFLAALGNNLEYLPENINVGEDKVMYINKNKWDLNSLITAYIPKNPKYKEEINKLFENDKTNMRQMQARTR